MNRPIRTYEDLLIEEKRLEAQAESYRILIGQDVSAIKEGLNPVKRVVHTVKNIFTMENNGPLINFGLNFGLDVIVRKVLLAKAGWVSRFLVPFVVKNYASHIIAEEDKAKVIGNIKKFIERIIPKKMRKQADDMAPEA